MIQFLFKKLVKNKLMVLCLLVGNILLVGIVSATPLYSNATMERILQQGFRQYSQENQRHPAILDLRLSLNMIRAGEVMPTYLYTQEIHMPNILDNLGIPSLMTIETHMLSTMHLVTVMERDTTARDRSVSFLAEENIFDHVEIIYGRLPVSHFVMGYDGEYNVMEVVATEAALINHDLLVNETMRVNNMSRYVGPLYVRIVGIYDFRPGSEVFWTTLDFRGASTMLMPNELMHERFIGPDMAHYRVVANWFHVLDYSQFTARDIERYIATMNESMQSFGIGSPWRLTANFTRTLEAYVTNTGPLSTTLWVLQVPVFVLLAFYIYMVSRQILMQDQNDISVLKSRGASRVQILLIYVMQGLVVSVISLPIGIWLGYMLCQVLGASSGFLHLVQRATLAVVFTSDVFIYTGIAIVLSFFMSFLPVIGFSRITIVEHKLRKRGHTSKRSIWQRFYLDILCLAVSLYGLFTFNAQREVMAAQMRANQSVDPLLFISSSLFIMGAGLFLLRLFPYMVRLIYAIGRRFWAPQTYAAIIRVIRSAGEEQFIMIFLMFTLSVGIFSANAARTINTNSEHRIQYLAGADLMFREFWRNNIPQVSEAEAEMMGIAIPNMVVYFEPDFERFTGFDQVEAITRVQSQRVRVQATDSRVDHVSFMAIETHTFGETIWFRDDLLRLHINHFLNALAENPNGVLLSSNFSNVLGYSLGDRITVRNAHQQFAFLEVIGFVDYWPGFASIQTERLSTGELVQSENYLAVANLGHMQYMWGTQPYQVWMRTAGSNQFFYDFQAENNLLLIEFSDMNASIIESRNDPILQGKNGVLTMNFIVTLLICFVGFLIYWVLSIRSRVLQFGVFKAMGMSKRRLISLLLNEQILITFTSIVIGAIVGEIAARLFVPLIQLSYTAADQVIPLVVVTEIRDYVNLYTAMGVMVAVCLAILWTYAAKIRIDQALKLGEDS